MCWWSTQVAPMHNGKLDAPRDVRPSARSVSFGMTISIVVVGRVVTIPAPATMASDPGR